jgi:hypothetical protein
MGFSITVKCTDYGIASTKISNSNIGSKTYSYGDNPDPISGLTSVSCTATARSGYSFSYWAYTTDSGNHTSESTKFSYDGSDGDITIHAVSTSGSSNGGSSGGSSSGGSSSGGGSSGGGSSGSSSNVATVYFMFGKSGATGITSLSYTTSTGGTGTVKNLGATKELNFIVSKTSPPLITFTANLKDGYVLDTWYYSSSGTPQPSSTDEEYSFYLIAGETCYFYATAKATTTSTYTVDIYVDDGTDDVGVNSVTYESSGGSKSGTVKNGKSSTGIAVPSSESVTFTANLKSGYELSYWYVRIGGDSAARQKKYGNPYTYDNQDDKELIIRPVATAVTTSSDGVWIYYNSAWHTATPYIYYNSAWRECTAYIYNNGWVAL